MENLTATGICTKQLRLASFSLNHYPPVRQEGATVPVAITPIYEPDPSHTAKHRSDLEEARIEEDDDGCPVGKCPKSIDQELAQRLLDEGIRWSPRTHRSRFP